MASRNYRIGMIIIVALVGGITFLHYITKQSQHHYHIFYREFYFLPIILASFYFGLRGGLTTSLTITALYLSFTLKHWQGFSPDDFDKILEMVLFNMAALVLGKLVDRECVNERRLRQAENLAAMGTAVASVAHDIKTPIVAIGGMARRVRKHLKPIDPNVERLDIVIRESDRLEEMVRDMLDFSRPLKLYKSYEGVEKLIDECLSIVGNRAQEKKVTIKVEFPEVLPPATFDPLRLKQALVNLLVNAIEASPEKETVTVHVFRGEGSIIFDVKDCGCGIPLEKRDHVFHPFFTTKKGGTGLGLPIAQKILEAHGGDLEVKANAGKGVTFRLVLPIRRWEGRSTDFDSNAIV